VRHNSGEVGGLAAEFLAGQLHHNIHGVPEIATTTFVEGTWFDGASCPMNSDTEFMSSPVPKRGREILALY
jgi:LacI family transcriptional regulator